MHLAEFIEDNFDLILEEWEAFARKLRRELPHEPGAYRLRPSDYAAEVLAAITDDMRSFQTTSMQVAKSQGESRNSRASRQIDQASVLHAQDRVTTGFDLGALIAEYRALRTNVLRLWSQSASSDNILHMEDLTRFNEAVDQSLSEAVKHFTSLAAYDRDELFTSERGARLEAQEANHAKDLFLANLSHEMRTLLNATVGWTDILCRSKGLDAEIIEALKVIKQSSSAQLVLIEDMIDVTRIVSGKMRLELRECDFFEVINAAVSIVRPAALEKDVAINVSLAPAARRGVADPSRIQQIMWNLMSNAVRFTPPGGVVSISLSQDAAGLRLDVKDTGSGIDPDLLPHVFNSFRQGTLACHHRASGLGLGLAIVKHLVALHGGTVEAQSLGFNSGATFIVRLPNLESDEGTSERALFVRFDDSTLSLGADHTSAFPLGATGFGYPRD